MTILVIEVTNKSVSPVTTVFYDSTELPEDSQFRRDLNRYKLINCSCPAYGRERQILLPRIQDALRNGTLTPLLEVPRGATILRIYI